ncbi:MAG: DUF45 domain-containing protein [Clostridia bacterium]|nr:DUF45 domain-containing protein [Clostridia bacterium]
MAKTETVTVSKGGKSLTFTLTRKRIKNMNMRVQRDGSIHVSAPTGTLLENIKKFVLAHFERVSDAAARQRARRSADKPPLALVSGEMIPIWGKERRLLVQKGKATASFLCDGGLMLFAPNPDDPASRQRAFWSFAREEALRHFAARVDAFHSLFAPVPLHKPLLEVKWLESRWGSCRPARNLITLNLKLLFLHPAYGDYVLLHEYCHYRVLNHSADFYRELERVCPHHAEARKYLNRAVIPPLPR